MIVISAEQIAAFATSRQRQFENKLLVHLHQFWPLRCEQLGEPVVRESIATAIDTCAEHGICIEYDVGRYLDLMYALSFELETLPWVRTILTREQLSGTEKMDALFSLAVANLERQEAPGAGGVATDPTEPEDPVSAQ